MTDSTLGEFIRQSRRQKGLSVAELARRAEISSPFLSEIERGRRNPSDNVLQRLAIALGVDAEKLRELNTVAAFWEFREIIEKDRDLNLAFTQMVRKFKQGKITAKALIKRLRG